MYTAHYNNDLYRGSEIGGAVSEPFRGTPHKPLAKSCNTSPPKSAVWARFNRDGALSAKGITQAEAEELNSKIVKLQEQVIELEEKNAVLTAELDDFGPEKFEEYDLQIAEKIDQAEAQVLRERANEALKLKAAEDTVARLKTELSRTTTQVSESEKSISAKLLQAAAEKSNSLADQKAASEKERSELQKAVALKQTALAQAHRDLEELEEANAACQLKASSEETRANEATCTLGKVQDALRQKADELDEANDRISALQQLPETVAELQAELDSVKRELQEEKMKSVQAETKASQVTEAQSEHLRELQDELEGREQAVVSIEEQLETTRNETCAKLVEVNRKENELKSLETELRRRELELEMRIRLAPVEDEAGAQPPEAAPTPALTGSEQEQAHSDSRHTARSQSTDLSSLQGDLNEEADSAPVKKRRSTRQSTRGRASKPPSPIPEDQEVALVPEDQGLASVPDQSSPAPATTERKSGRANKGKRAASVDPADLNTGDRPRRRRTTLSGEVAGLSEPTPAGAPGALEDSDNSSRYNLRRSSRRSSISAGSRG
ncbi:hypothetical protein CYMTET_43018 [Cymbomonas tetramitiformis]|uniref:Uncharacterized protein n=1 Tax=Cymbomonas tetramitiformis TaxID=36881 RepID=A0AAE0C308_9CHLO|nr:hypothetical protein CYMTET_43018 [Cymbomonas tetramitiformis]